MYKGRSKVARSKVARSKNARTKRAKGKKTKIKSKKIKSKKINKRPRRRSVSKRRYKGGALNLKGKDNFWEELNDAEKEAAKFLGWVEDTWNEGSTEPMEYKFWAEVPEAAPAGARVLTDEERQAAETLGHTKATWDDGS